MFKKAISLVLSLMLIVTSLSVTIFSVSAADGSRYKVAGVDELTGDGPTWKPDVESSPENEMTLQEDGTYVKVYTDVAVGSNYALKVVENTADGNYNWIGKNGVVGDDSDNIVFNVTSVCDVTVTFDPVSLLIEVTGDGVEMVEGLNIEYITAVGAGDGAWLNDIGWDPAAEENRMTEVSTGVYEITFEGVEAYDNYSLKFAANGSWQPGNWGGTFQGLGVETPLEYGNNPSNITVEIPYGESDVTIRLDLTNFDASTKLGATMTITAVSPLEPSTSATVETTEAPTTEAPTTEAPTTEASAGLTVKATSNYFPEQIQTVPADAETVTVTYLLDSAKDVLNTEWKLNYDPSVLSCVSKKTQIAPQFPAAKNAMVNIKKNEDDTEVGEIKGNATNLTLYSFANLGSTPFVTVTFKVLGSGETEVNLNVKVLTTSLLDEDEGLSDSAQEDLLLNKGEIQTVDKNTGREYVHPVRTTTIEFPELPTTAVVTTEAPTTEAPTTEAPTTEAPTTEAPTTEAPTTEAPTTEAPTTEAPTTEAPTTEAPTTEAPTTEAPTTEAPTTEAPTTEAPTTISNQLNITATSNFFAPSYYTVPENAETDLVTVKYIMESDKKLLNTQWLLKYDPEVLELVPGSYMPYVSDAAYNTTADTIEGDCSSLGLYDIPAGKPFVQVTFKVLKNSGETTVDLFVKHLNVSELNPETGLSDESKEEPVVTNGQVVSEAAKGTSLIVPGPGETVPTTEAPTTEAPTTEAPTTEAPTTEAPTTEAPTTEAPTTEAPTTEAPTTEAPTTEAPTTEAPTTEAPTTEAPTTEAPTTEAPTTEAPTTEAPTTTVVTEPSTEAPTTEVIGTTSTDVPSSTGEKPATSGQATSDTPSGSNGAVQTGSAPMAVIILLVLVSACGILYFTRKRVK